VERDGRLVELDRPGLLEDLATRHASLLAGHGMRQLNIALAEDVPELLQVCAEYHLALDAEGAGAARTPPALWRP
jgi:hypothetical protein